MATAVTNHGRSKPDVRSLHGCWTCRLRKKKCDENRPACSVCVSLELPCQGYGDKPIWMDNGPRQREQSLIVKGMVSQSNARKRKRLMLHPSASLPDVRLQTDTIFDEPSRISHGPSSSSSDRVSLNAAGWEQMVPEVQIPFYSWERDLDPLDQEFSSARQENNFTAEWFANDSGWESEICIENDHSGFSAMQPSVPSKPSEISQDSETTLTSPNAARIQKNSGPVAFGLSQQSRQLGDMTSSGTTAPWSMSRFSTPTRPLMNTNNAIEEYPTPRLYLRDPNQPGEIEDKLFLHYLDEVFCIQYPFYNTPHKQSRLWMFSILRRVKSVYYATMALSERHMKSEPSSKMNYYDMALHEIELSIGESSSLSGTASLVRSVEGVTCILQILFCELFSGGVGNWQSHLRRASTLISPLARAMGMAIGLTLGAPDRDIGRSQDRSLYYWDETGTRVLLGSFIWFDILACASTRSQPSLDLDHTRVLETFGVDLTCLFGCSNLVAVTLLEIIHLDNWKKEAEKTRQLSMVELVKRGAEIEERLHKNSPNLEATHPSRSKVPEGSRDTPSASQTEVTTIFALSALTYLHVIVSGAYPELPEIADSVSKTITALENLSDPRLLRHLVWPFCVTGCLALSEQQSCFRSLLSKADITPSTVGTCLQAYRIMEECWELRKTCSHNFEWAYITNKLGYNVLLI